MKLFWTLVVITILGFAQAQQSSETQRLERDVQSYQELLEERQAEQAEISAALRDTTAQLGAQLAERDQLNAQIDDLQTQRADLLDRAGVLEQESEATKERITNLQSRLSDLERRLQGLLVNLHKQRGGRYARLLSRSESIFDLRVKSYYLSRLTDQDVALMQEMERTVTELQSGATHPE